MHVDCVSRLEPLTSQKVSSSSSSEPSGSLCSDENNMHIDVNNKVKALGGRERERRLRGIFQGWVVSVNSRRLGSC